MNHRYSQARILLLCAAALIIGFAPTVQAQNLHDTRWQALPITGDGSGWSYSAAGAVDENAEVFDAVASCQANDGGNSTWAFLRPTVDAQLTVDLLGSDFDTIMVIMTAGGTEIACNDDTGPNVLTSRLENVPILAGEGYFIRITGWNGEEGNVTMDVNTGLSLIHPMNTISTPGGIIPFGDRVYFNWNFNTRDTGEALASCANDSGKSVWYAINLSGPLTLDIETEQTTFDTILSIYDPSQNEVACDDDGGVGTASKLTHSFPQGQSYIRISGHVNNPEGSFFLSVNPANAVAGEESAAALSVELSPVYPNPVVDQAMVAYQLADAGAVRLAVYDVLGREVALLVNDVRPSGAHTAPFDASDLPGGLYIVRLEANGVATSQSLTIAR